MSYTRFSIKTTHAAADTLCVLLADCGISAFEIEDRADMLEFFAQNRALYDYIDDGLINAPDEGVFVHVYLEDEGVIAEIQALLSTLDKGVFGSLETVKTFVVGEDWAESWKKYFHVTPVGRKLLICPEWESLVSNPDNRAVFKVDPGQVFGTGTHDSTRLCMELAEEVIRGGERVLDLGCGTGILGITACLLGAKSAQYADINENARAAVAHNCEINGVPQGRIYVGDILTEDLIAEDGFDLVFANIVADVIIAAAAKLRRFGKRLIASGIIDSREDEVKSALESAGFTLEKRVESRGWVAFLMK